MTIIDTDILAPTSDGFDYTFNFERVIVNAGVLVASRDDAIHSSKLNSTLIPAYPVNADTH